jgi:hypothetical protein
LIKAKNGGIKIGYWDFSAIPGGTVKIGED